MSLLVFFGVLIKTSCTCSYMCMSSNTHTCSRVTFLQHRFNLPLEYFLPSLGGIPLSNCLPLATFLKFSERLLACGSDVYQSVSRSSPKKFNLW